MTKKLEEFFDMATASGGALSTSAALTTSDTSAHMPIQHNSVIESLAEVADHSLAMDELATSALATFEEIMEIARNSEERNAAQILATAVQMHKNAMDAKDSKARVRLQSAQLLLRKQAHDEKKALQDASVIDNEQDHSEDGMIIGDRNEILRAIKEQTQTLGK